MAGNHLKRCALMRWSFSILNDNTKCLVWWVNNRNTEAGKTKTKVIQKASKGHQISTKLIPKRAKVSPNDAQEQKYRFLIDFDTILETISAQLSIKNPIKWLKKGLRKSMQEKYWNFMIKSWKNHAKMAPKFNHKSCEIQHSRFLWFCKESNVFLSF